MRSIVTRFLDYSGENVTILFFQENSHNWCSTLMFIAEQVRVSLDRCSKSSKWNRFFSANRPNFLNCVLNCLKLPPKLDLSMASIDRDTFFGLVENFTRYFSSVPYFEYIYFEIVSLHTEHITVIKRKLTFPFSKSKI